MITYADRLEWAMKCAGLNPQSDQSELARRVGDGCKPQNIQYLLDHNKNAKSSKYTQHLANVLGCDPAWLAYGEGSAPLPQGQDGRMKHVSAAGDPPNKAPKGVMFKTAQKDHGGKILVDEPSRGYKNVVPAPRDLRHIPVISYVQAGKMTEAVDPYALGEGFETILTDLDVSARTFALIIEGTSMFPEFNEGDKVIIDPDLSPRPGDFVVAKNTQEEATFKKYRPRGTGERGEMVFELVPLNDDFPTLHSERDHLHIIGVMAEHRKYRRR